MNRLSVSSLALLIVNLNSMIGAGIFLYPALIAASAGSMGFLSFGIVFCIMLPIVLTIAQIAILYPTSEAGLYFYSKNALGRWAGMVLAIVYFIAKTISCSIMLRIFVFNLYNLIPIVTSIPTTLFRVAIVILIFIFNLFGIHFGIRLQTGFIILKLTPLFMVILGGIFLFNSQNLTIMPASFGAFVSSFPIALYTMMGFETCCAIGHVVGNAKKMAYSVVGSFLAVTSIYMLFQFFLFGSLGSAIVKSVVPLSLFFEALFKNASNHSFFSFLGIVAILISSFGAAYGIMYASSWYAFVVGKELNAFPLLHLKNRFGAPVSALLLQGVLICFFFLLPDKIEILARLSVFGVLLLYMITAIALLQLYKVRKGEIALPRLVVQLSLVSCSYIAFICIKDML